MACHEEGKVMRMGFVFMVVMLLGAGILLRSLRLWGCIEFVLWVALGVMATWFVLQFASGGLRI